MIPEPASRTMEGITNAGLNHPTSSSNTAPPDADTVRYQDHDVSRGFLSDAKVENQDGDASISSSFVPLVYPRDETQISGYHYLVLQQLVLCRVAGSSSTSTVPKKQDRKNDENSSSLDAMSSSSGTGSGSSSIRPYSIYRQSGYGGVCCRHCAVSVTDMRHARMFFSANPRKFKSSGFSHVVEHLVICRFVPNAVLTSMEQMRERRKMELRKFTLEERDRFWGKIWARIRYLDGLPLDHDSSSWMDELLVDDGRILEALKPIAMPTRNGTRADSKVASSPQSSTSDSSRTTKQQKSSPDSTSIHSKISIIESTDESFGDIHESRSKSEEIQNRVLTEQLPYPWKESDVVLTNEFAPIIYPSDADSLTSFHRLCLLSLTLCRCGYDSSARKYSGQSSGYKIGHGGVCCRHCHTRKFYSDRAPSFKSSGLSHVIEHLSNCNQVPTDLKLQLDAERKRHKNQQRQIPQEAKNQLWNRIWARLRFLDLMSESWMEEIQDGRIERIGTVADDKNSSRKIQLLDGHRQNDQYFKLSTSIKPSSCISEKIPFVFVSDESSLSIFHFQCMKQLVLCKNEESVSLGKNISYPSGYGGIRCRHCVNKARKPRSFYSSDLGTFRNSGLSHVIDHLLNCLHSSAEAKAELLSAKVTHKTELRKIPLGDRNALWGRIWRRIRSVDMFDQENWESEIFNTDLESLCSSFISEQSTEGESYRNNHIAITSPAIKLDDDQLVQVDEMHLVPLYQYFTLNQMRICRVTQTSHCSLTEKQFPTGYGGITCKFCNQGSDRLREFFVTVDELRSSIDSIFQHLQDCACTPSSVKSVLRDAYSKKRDHELLLLNEAPTEFWSMVWRRIHFVEESKMYSFPVNNLNRDKYMNALTKRKADSSLSPFPVKQKVIPTEDGSLCDLAMEYNPKKARHLKRSLPVRGQQVSDYFSMIAEKLTSLQ